MRTFTFKYRIAGQKFQIVINAIGLWEAQQSFWIEMKDQGWRPDDVVVDEFYEKVAA